jgi:serine/threonine-protein kinase
MRLDSGSSDAVTLRVAMIAAVTNAASRRARPDKAYAGGPLQSGTILANSYRLLHPIGEGGMGRIWVADHIALKRHVAIKVMSEATLAAPVARELFNREAQATARIDNPHVVRVLDFDVTEDGFPFLVLELLEGETLEDRIVQTGPLSLLRAWVLLQQVSHALDAAHACGILHRDIKAENVFLVGNHERIDVRLLDFGVASLKDRGVLAVGTVGTLQYMSPEQLACGPLDERSDLFSLAICMYHALTGHFPFEGSSGLEIAAAHLRPYIPISERRPDLSAMLDVWFSQAVACDREMRFSDTAQMCKAFAQSLGSSPVTPIEREATVTPIVPRRRHFARWGLLAAVVAALAFAHPKEVTSRVADALRHVPTLMAITPMSTSTATRPAWTHKLERANQH